MHMIRKMSSTSSANPSVQLLIITRSVYQATPNFHPGPALTTPAGMWNMLARWKKGNVRLYSGWILFFHVSVSWTSWQQSAPKHTDRLSGCLHWEREETSKNTDCFGSFLTFMCVRPFGRAPRALLRLTNVEVVPEAWTLKEKCLFGLFLVFSLFTWERKEEICYSAGFLFLDVLCETTKDMKTKVF